MRTGRRESPRIFLMTICIYSFDIFGGGVFDRILLEDTDIDIDTAKREAHQRAIALYLKAESQWHDQRGYSTRKYRTLANARRLIVIDHNSEKDTAQ